MRLKAKDTLHVSSVGPDPIRPGESFEVNDDEGRQLVQNGYAVEAKADKAAPANKAEPAPANKGIISAFDHDKDGRDGGAPKGGNRPKLKLKG